MSTRTITQIICDGCNRTGGNIVSTYKAVVAYGTVKMVETHSDDKDFRDGRKRRDYCEECVESDVFFCESCKVPHQSICPKEEAEMDAWYEANKDTLIDELGF